MPGGRFTAGDWLLYKLDSAADEAIDELDGWRPDTDGLIAELRQARASKRKDKLYRVLQKAQAHFDDPQWEGQHDGGAVGRVAGVMQVAKEWAWDVDLDGVRSGHRLERRVRSRGERGTPAPRMTR